MSREEFVPADRMRTLADWMRGRGHAKTQPAYTFPADELDLHRLQRHLGTATFDAESLTVRVNGSSIRLRQRDGVVVAVREDA